MESAEGTGLFHSVLSVQNIISVYLADMRDIIKRCYQNLYGNIYLFHSSHSENYMIKRTRIIDFRFTLKSQRNTIKD